MNQVTSTLSIENKKSEQNTIPQDNHETGHLTMIYGPMFSDKTTQLLTRLTRYADMGYKVLYINHSIDNRDTKSIISSIITTHSSTNKTLSPLISVIKADDLSTINVLKYDVIGCDELQFFLSGTGSDKQHNTIRGWINNYHKIVIGASLSGTAKLEPFGKANDLLSDADDVIICKAVCLVCRDQRKAMGLKLSHTGVAAPFTSMKSIEKNVQAGGASASAVNVGGEDKYISCCRYHYNILNKIGI
jgi:thymidine kinase